MFAKRRFRGYGNTVGALAKFVSRDKAHGGIKRAGLETGLTEQVAGTFRGIIAVPIAGKRCLRQTNQHSKTRARSVGRVATRSLTRRAGPLPAFAITHVTLHT
ncbi:MAG: hypothetical protein DMG98_20970 [Acidobacteria bacterium]|nr:MAG: hypothetical protein DMG98_20970 [Acidobacteriota bacterium]